MNVSLTNSHNLNNISSQQASFVMCYEPKTAKIIKTDNIFEKLNTFIHNAKIVTLKTYGDEKISAKLVSPRGVCTKYIKLNKKTLGAMHYSFSSAYIRGDNYPQEYKGEKYLFINSIYSNKQYRQTGTQLIKEAVRESYKQGCEGRVCLTATTTNPEFGSPVPFYFKFGFESADKNKQKRIEEALISGKKIPKDCESTTMFLPTNRIYEILNEPVAGNVWVC